VSATTPRKSATVTRISSCQIELRPSNAHDLTFVNLST
jgi:hypothetical protein